MKESSKELLGRTEELIRLEKEDMKEQLDTAKNNKEVLDDIDDVIKSEKILIELFQSDLEYHIQSIENNKNGLIKTKQEIIEHKEELKKCLEEIEQEEFQNDPVHKVRKQDTINNLYQMIEIEEDLVVQYKKGPRVAKSAVRASRSLIKRHTKRLERLTRIRDNIQQSIDYQINDAEISRQNIVKYEAEIERYKREIEEDRKNI